MAKYQRLNFHEREELSRLLAMRHSIRSIAKMLTRSPSSLSREIKRNTKYPQLYRAVFAQQRANKLARNPRRQLKLDQNIRLREFIFEQINQQRWSPQQIAKRLIMLYPKDMSMRASHETIYAYLYVHPRGTMKKRMIQYLRRKHKNRRVKNKERQKSSPIQDYVSIDERPPEANGRTITGHWEGDLLMGSMNKSAIGTLVERKTRFTLLVTLTKKDATSVREAFAKKFNNLPKELKKSLTYDQGQEMAEHKIFTQETKIQVYFAHPHSPWERGTSENTNGLIRDFFPKGTDFSKISEQEIQEVEDKLNDRPRQIHNFYTPREVFTNTEPVALET